MNLFYSAKFCEITQMANVKVVSKKTHEILLEGQKDNLTLSEPSVVLLQIDIKDVNLIEKDGRNVKVTLKSSLAFLKYEDSLKFTEYFDNL